MDLEHRALPFEMKASSDTGEFSGLASAFYIPDDSWTCDIIAPGAFTDTLAQFLDRGFVGGVGHNWRSPIGKPLEARETAAGLEVRAKISNTADGRDTRTLLQDGVIRTMSIGFRTLARTWLETSSDVLAWWHSVGYAPTPRDLATVKFGARLITKLHLFEFSPVAVPANPGALITSVKTAPEPRGFDPAAHAIAYLGTMLAMPPAELQEAAAAPGFRRLQQLCSDIQRIGAMPPSPSVTAALYKQFLAIPTP